MRHGFLSGWVEEKVPRQTDVSAQTPSYLSDNTDEKSSNVSIKWAVLTLVWSGGVTFQPTLMTVW